MTLRQVLFVLKHLQFLLIQCAQSITLRDKLDHASFKMFLTFSRTLSAVSSFAAGISFTHTHRWRPSCSKSSFSCSSLVTLSRSSPIADLHSSFCFFVAFCTSKWISSLISDKRSVLSSLNFSLVTLITSNSLISIGVALPDLVSGILKQGMTITLKETTAI